MAISFPCALCRSVNTFEDSWANMRAACQRCGNYLTVPAESSASPEQFAERLPPAPPPPTRPAAPPPIPGGGTDARPSDWVGDLPRARDYEDDYRPRGRARDYDEDDDWRRPRDLAPSWNVVRIGMTIMFWAAIAIVILMVMSFAFAVLINIAEGGGGRMRGDALGPIMGLFVLAGLLGALVWFAGLCMCIAAPPESRGRGLAVAATICAVVGTLTLFGGFFVALFITRGFRGFGGPDFAQAILPIIVVLAGFATLVAAHILHVLFLKAVARYFRNESIAQGTSGYLTLVFVFLGLYAVVLCMTIGIRDPSAAVFLLCFGVVMLGLLIAVIVWYLILLARTRASIG